MTYGVDAGASNFAPPSKETTRHEPSKIGSITLVFQVARTR
jgi:hypothetical protein